MLAIAMTPSVACSTCVASEENYKFTGKERDPESGLDNFGARYDSSSMGRFMSPDPLYIEAHRLADPQRLNLYAYARNNPANFTDPTGLDVTLKCDTKDNCAKAVSDFNNRKGAQFKVELGKDGKLQVVKGSVAKDLSKAEGALLGAVNDTKNHATINVVGNTGDASFGVHDSKGVNTVDLQNLSQLDAASTTRGASTQAMRWLTKRLMLTTACRWVKKLPMKRRLVFTLAYTDPPAM